MKQQVEKIIKEDIPRISVLVITYKQENIVSRTLDSLIKQKDYLYEICVSDDCSPDGTWDILLDYQKKYPDLIKLHRQNPNVGIFENTEYTWSMPTGDVINEIAGDDVTPNGWYKTVIEYILKNGIDYKNGTFCIYGDYLAQYPNGDSIVFSNKAIKKFPQEALSLAWRGIIGGRGCCYSMNVLRHYEKVSQGRSHIAEFLQDRMRQIHSKDNYYIPFIANIYYTGIGVSAHLDEDTIKERRKIRPYAEKYIDEKGIKLSQTDRYYGRYLSAIIAFRFHRTMSNFIEVVNYWAKSFNIRYLLSGSRKKLMLFSIIRRIPHKKPIHF